MKNQMTLDASWQKWVQENLDSGCDPGGLVQTLLNHHFPIQAIQHSMGVRFPVAYRVDQGFKYTFLKNSGSTEIRPDMGKRRLDDEWKGWVKENMARGCNPRELFDILQRNHFTRESIVEFMVSEYGSAEGLPIDMLAGASDKSNLYQALANPPLLRNASGANLHKVDSDKLQLYVLDDFLSHEECTVLTEVINNHLHPSTVTLKSEDKYFRTSSTCDLSLLDNPVVAAIDEKIAITMGIRLAYSEGNQAQRYDVGQEFKAHTDYFEPGTNEYLQYAAGRGNRTWTFMVYLNEGMSGGGTRFHRISKTFEPKTGQAVIWNNLYPDGTPNPNTLHSGEPVVQGHKLIITKWFRERGVGPMFY